jgi:hypothetical protein
MSFRCRFTLLAASVSAAASAANAQAPSDGEAASRWRITPYLWAAGLDGDTAADGGGTEIDTGYSFLSLDNLDGVVAMAAEANVGRWRVLLDGLYLQFSDAFAASPLATPEAELAGGFVETSAAYPAARIPGLELVFGMRYVALESTVRVTSGAAATARESWLDPLVGARFEHAFNERWSVTLRGDVGGFGASSELATNVVATFGYRLGDVTTLRFGYRVLQMDFEDERFLLDAIAQGYVVGVSFAL